MSGYDEEMMRRLMKVMKKHPNLDFKPIAQHEDMGFQPHEKQAITQHETPEEQIAKTIAGKKDINQQIKNMHKVSKKHGKPGYNEFADDLAREFDF
jgi:hypothetical protein